MTCCTRTHPWIWSCLCAVTFVSPIGAGEEAGDAVPLPPGETPLAAIGIYRVWWQSYD